MQKTAPPLAGKTACSVVAQIYLPDIRTFLHDLVLIRDHACACVLSWFCQSLADGAAVGAGTVAG